MDKLRKGLLLVEPRAKIIPLIKYKTKSFFRSIWESERLRGFFKHRCFGFHSWTQWSRDELYRNKRSSWQAKSCTRCNKVKRRGVKHN